MKRLAEALTRSCLLWMIACAGGTEPTGPEDCAADEVLATQCSDCGPADECIDPREVCAPACEADGAPCETGLCLDGACLQNVCG